MTKPPKSAKIKVCLVATSLGRGGAERSCAMLSQMLDSLDFEVHIVILQDKVDQDYAGELLNLGKGKKVRDSLASRLLRIRKLKNYLNRNKIDFVIDHRPKNDSKKEAFYDRYVYKGIRRIYVVHSANKATYFSENEDRMTAIYAKNYATVAVSEYIEKALLNTAGIHNTTTIYNAFDASWTREIGSPPELLNEKKYLLWYGRIVDEIKDLRFLIDAYLSSEIWKTDFSLVIMGAGPDLEELKRYSAESKAAQDIIFLPHTDDPFPVISNARATLLTSRYEGFPMVLVESLSVGTPVVSLDIASGPSEIVVDGENGLLIAERSLPLFSEAIQRICKDDLLYERLSNTAKASVRQFSSDVIAVKWKKLLA